MIGGSAAVDLTGISQNIHSWDSAQSPWNSATAVLRAGLTEVLVTHLGQSGAQYRRRAVPGRLGAVPAVDVLADAGHRGLLPIRRSLTKLRCFFA
jgi:hypothetical protein